MSKTDAKDTTKAPNKAAPQTDATAADSGAAAFGSPKRTAALSNLATSCRTRDTSPCGDKLVMVNACAAPVAKSANVSSAPRKRVVPVVIWNSRKSRGMPPQTSSCLRAALRAFCVILQ